ncbi:radical SAM protein [Lysobacter sp. 5GHs7-4]|uniref:radical SAM protein n=1 Tax=Lysobacter sp. 5GHs7-4 TaxID=2904253 RepID=UPI001E54C1D4|nr:radical SAM protein [Lysobacter sp. 5GHs7-4]UHQ23748.1 radical SAM protein [Lysobacter sp. 5GHs7-4]
MTTISKTKVALSLDSRILELILLPTEKCNFRCSYCYEDFELGKMPEYVRNGIKNLIRHRADSIKILKLSWFGGEPLLASDVILDIANFAKDVAESNDFVVTGGLTTNGYLLTENTVKRLSQVNHRSYQITLDGDREEHNRTRLRADGRGTFDEIWNNLIRMAEIDESLDVTLRIHVSNSNQDSINRLLNRINDQLAYCGKFRIHFHRISNLGGDGGKSVTELPWSEYKRILNDLSSRTSVQASSEVVLSEEGEICYAAKPNSLLIRSDGRVGKCTVALSDPRNDVGVLAEDGTIQFSNERLRLWFEGFRSFDPDTLGCPLSTLPHLNEHANPFARPIELALVGEH